MDPFEGTPLRETWNERTSEFTHFNLVIRLSKVNSWLVRVSHAGRFVELWAAAIGQSFFACRSRTDCYRQVHMNDQGNRRMDFPLCVVFVGFRCG